MDNITHHLLSNTYTPQKALVVYQSDNGDRDAFVEAYDMDSHGCPINAHPLSVEENIALAALMDSAADRKWHYLVSRGLLPCNVLYISLQHNGHVIWHTPAQQVYLYFNECLGIPCGTAGVPAMIWKATREQLYVYAIRSKKPVMITPLYHAPSSNIYKNGNVCMGTVSIAISADCALEDFLQQWEQYFWNSYFSQLIDDFNPVCGNLVPLWKGLVNSPSGFDDTVLVRNGHTLADIL